MKITTVIAILLGLGGAASAQDTGLASPPAELPPADYSDRHYIDSRGCFYIRADVGGIVSWVPRVDRKRQPVCGYEPSLAAAPQTETTTLTLEGVDEAQAESPVPETQAAQTLAPRPVPVAVATPKPAVRPAATPAAYRAKPARKVVVRPAAPRIVPKHVWENRQNTRNVTVPKGYRPAWDDDRLNPYRGERTAAPSQASPYSAAPRGYKPAWDDDRLNPRRGGSAAGDAQTDQIWTRSLPRKLVPQPYGGRAEPITNNARRGNSPYWVPPVAAQTVTHLSTRSASAYVRVAVYATETDARTTARALARGGMPMRLGTLQQGGTSYSLVLAGPFATPGEAQTALAQVRQAGFANARLGK